VLDTLPDTLRVPLLIADLDGFSYEEIAETLKIGLSAVKMRIKRGREEFGRATSPFPHPRPESSMADDRKRGPGKGDPRTAPRARPGPPAPGAADLDRQSRRRDWAGHDRYAGAADRVGRFGCAFTLLHAAGIRGKIGRRVLTADVVDFATTSPLAVFIRIPGVLPVRTGPDASGRLPPVPRYRPIPRGDGRNGGSN
jgi:hypothetical protein